MSSTILLQQRMLHTWRHIFREIYSTILLDRECSTHDFIYSGKFTWQYYWTENAPHMTSYIQGNILDNIIGQRMLHTWRHIFREIHSTILLDRECSTHDVTFGTKVMHCFSLCFVSFLSNDVIFLKRVEILCDVRIHSRFFICFDSMKLGMWTVVYVHCGHLLLTFKIRLFRLIFVFYISWAISLFSLQFNHGRIFFSDASQLQVEHLLHISIYY